MRPLIPVAILEYQDCAGRNRFHDWFDRLEASTAAKVTAALARLEKGSWSQVASVGSGVHELRIDVGPGYRVYFGSPTASSVLLLGGGTKSGQRRDIVRARRDWQEYRRRKQRGDTWH